MSRRDVPETVAERIEEVRQLVKPPPGRKARKPYISKDDLAVLLKVGRSRVYAWTRNDRPEYPDEASQRKLAGLSQGRYQPADFAREEKPDRPGSLVAAVLELTQDVRDLADRVALLERRARPRSGRGGSKA